MNWISAGGVLMFLGVAFGAFGAHGLRGRLTPDLLQVFETGVRYQIYHALALFVVAWLSEKASSPWVTSAGWTFLAGVVLFSGSLYLYVLTGIKPLVFVTPIGGLLFLIGWASLVIASLRRS